jgi:cation diffusion facilitator CzcD-associated flavoprotein CzcO
MQQFDMVIVGAGVSGIGAACHFREKCPGKTFAILESRDAIGGTWDLFRYPGIRSDSDMHTFGYNFKPWRNPKAIADGPSIREYVREAAREHDVDPHIRFNHRLRSARWSSAAATWTLEVETPDGVVEFSCNFLFMCGGYYSYAGGYTPDFPGMADFEGPVVHPQQWPDELDYSSKRVLIIGSGATAVTLLPAIAERAAHVTMLQRSPTYMVSRPDRDAIANRLRRIFPEKVAYAITRWKNTTLQQFFYRRTRVNPEWVKDRLLRGVRAQLGPDFDVQTHFTPSYNPWDQRLCLVPNGDFFRALRQGKATVVTDLIESFTSSGVRLKSGQTIEADVIVTATGLNLEVMSGVEFWVDEAKVNFPDTFTYKGMMFSGVPNLVQTFGYINASWTLRADLTSEYVCRLVNRMDELGVSQVAAQLREQDRDMPGKQWIDDFTPGYMQRSMHLFPKQGEKDPWRNTQNYAQDKKAIRHAPLEDGVLTFCNPDSAAPRLAGRASVARDQDAA